MASDKKRRKAAKAKKPRPAGPFRHPDGDRRHRMTGASVKQAIRDKKLLDMIGAVKLPEEEEEESGPGQSPPPSSTQSAY